MQLHNMDWLNPVSVAVKCSKLRKREAFGKVSDRADSLGLLGGGTFGQAYSMGPWGKIGVGTTGMGLSGYGLYASGRDIVERGLNPCNLLNAGMSTVGLVGSSLVIKQGVSSLRTASGADFLRYLAHIDFRRRENTSDDISRDILDLQGLPHKVV